MSAYYNEIDPFAAAWLRNLIAAGHIAPGDVDERSIREVSGDDLRGYRQCHFFAGVGVWSYALRDAGWADDAPVWTGSCPCQPFSVAGKRGGAADDRHLWPEFFRLIRQCRPAIVLGEQVAGKAGYGWWDAVSADLETEDYAGAAADLAAAGAGAPHIRQRLLWLAYRNGGAGGQGRAEFSGCGDRGNAHARRRSRSSGEPVGLADGRSPRLEIVSEQSARHECPAAERSGEAIGLGDAEQLSARRDAGASACSERGPTVRPVGDDAGSSGAACGLGHAQDHHGRLPDGRQRGAMSQPVGTGEAERVEHATGQRHGTHDLEPFAGRGELAARPTDSAHAADDRWSGPTNGFWRDADWLRCTDARWRPVEPATFPLASGIAGRVGRLRAYGNAMCAPLVVAFIQAAREALEDVRAA